MLLAISPQLSLSLWYVLWAGSTISMGLILLKKLMVPVTLNLEGSWSYYLLR